MGEHAGPEVAGRNADARRLLRRAGDRADAALGLHQHVVGLHPVVGRPGLAIAADVDRDQARIALAQALRAEARALRRTDREVLDPDVRLRQQPVQQGGVGRVLDVDGERLLAPVQPDEIGAEAVDIVVVIPGEVAVLPLQLDHARARVGEPAAEEGSGHGLLERDDENAVESTGHALFRLSRSLAARPEERGLSTPEAKARSGGPGQEAARPRRIAGEAATAQRRALITATVRESRSLRLTLAPISAQVLEGAGPSAVKHITRDHPLPGLPPPPGAQSRAGPRKLQPMSRFNYIEPLVMLATIMQWLVLATVTGILAGAGCAAFLLALEYLTSQTSPISL